MTYSIKRSVTVRAATAAGLTALGSKYILDLSPWEWQHLLAFPVVIAAHEGSEKFAEVTKYDMGVFNEAILAGLGGAALSFFFGESDSYKEILKYGLLVATADVVGKSVSDFAFGTDHIVLDTIPLG